MVSAKAGTTNKASPFENAINIAHGYLAYSSEKCSEDLRDFSLQQPIRTFVHQTWVVSLRQGVVMKGTSLSIVAIPWSPERKWKTRMAH